MFLTLDVDERFVYDIIINEIIYDIVRRKTYDFGK